MKLTALIHQLYHEPALILPEAHASIRYLIESRLSGDLSGEIVRTRRPPGQGICGQKVEVEQAQVIGGIMHIPLNGVIGQKLDPFTRGEGAVDVLDVANEIHQAEADDQVRAVLFEFDTPGGMIAGTPELAEQIASMSKPNVGFTNSLMCSAGYWIGSSCQRLYATPSSVVGAIGVLLPLIDSSAAMEKKGMKVDMIKAGRLKGAGWPGTSLTDEQRANLQERVDSIHSQFKAHVREARLLRGHLVEDADMEGQAFLGSSAQARGLVDQIVPNKAAVLRLL